MIVKYLDYLVIEIMLGQHLHIGKGRMYFL